MITLCPMKVFSKLEGTRRKNSVVVEYAAVRDSWLKFGLDASSHPQPPNLFTEPPGISLETVGTTMAQT